MAMDWAEQQARNALQQFRRGSQINGGCVEVYPAVADAIRDAYKRGKADGVKLGREAELEAALMKIYTTTYEGDPVRAIAKTALVG